jgi:hypothetical protein
MTPTIDPDAAVEAHTPMPISSSKVLQKMRLGKTAVGDKDYLALERKP